MPETLVGNVPSSWRVDTLGKLCAEGGGDIQTGPFGSQLHASDYSPAGVPVVMPANLGDNRIVLHGIARVDEATASRLSRHRLQDGDIIYSRRGDVERRALVRVEQIGWLCGTGCLRIRPGRLFSGRWLSYYLGHKSVRRWVVQHAIGATMPNLNTGTLQSLPVALPPRDRQEAVAELLDSLDDKIDLSRRTSATSQHLRSALIDIALRDSRPDVPLTELATFINGGAFTAHATGDGRPILRIRELSSGVDKQTPRTKMVVSQDHVAEPDTLLLAWSGSVGVHRWHWEQAVINQHIFKVLPKVPTWLVEYWLHRHVLWFRSIAADKATTMGHIQRHHLDEALCAVPDRGQLLELDKAVGPLYRLDHSLAKETAALGALRDALLPELISGRMTVN